ncbi:MAG: hypothetical protein QOG94_2090 [Solirubrobacteraceae bacterium]|nr:hypothetical protein [Solirubrobacteraceae bacterium]
MARADALAVAGRAVLVPALDLGVRGEQLDEVRRDVLRDVLAGAAEVREALRGQRDARLVAADDADAQRRPVRRAGEARRAVGIGRADAPVDDALVAELRAAERRVVGVDQALVAAPVDVERRALARGLRRVEVGVDVGAAEGVDRLLGVADQHERRVAAAERAPHDVPLDRVGVLELVYEHDAVAIAQPLRDRLAAGARERLLQARQQVVVAHDRQPALALV